MFVYTHIYMCLCVYLCLYLYPSLTILNFFHGLWQIFSSFWPLVPRTIPIFNIHVKHQLVNLDSHAIFSMKSFLLPQIQLIFLFIYPLVLVNTSVTLDYLFLLICHSLYEAFLIEVRGHIIFIVMLSIYFQQCLTHNTQ